MRFRCVVVYEVVVFLKEIVSPYGGERVACVIGVIVAGFVEVFYGVEHL